MLPKKIHYFWVGGNPMPEKIKRVSKAGKFFYFIRNTFIPPVFTFMFQQYLNHKFTNHIFKRSNCFR